MAIVASSAARSNCPRSQQTMRPPTAAEAHPPARPGHAPCICLRGESAPLGCRSDAAATALWRLPTVADSATVDSAGKAEALRAQLAAVPAGDMAAAELQRQVHTRGDGVCTACALRVHCVCTACPRHACTHRARARARARAHVHVHVHVCAACVCGSWTSRSRSARGGRLRTCGASTTTYPSSLTSSGK